MTASAIGSAPAATPSPSRQLAALVRMELLLLRRNLTATILSVVTPLAIGVALISGDYDTEGAVTKAAGVIGMIAVFAVHHHLTTVYAARRQETVLRRLRAGLPSDRTILVGAASAPVLIFLVLSVLLVAYAVLALGMPVPANPLTMLTAMVLGAAVLAAFGAALSAITRSTEAAMLTTLPTVAIFLLAPRGAGAARDPARDRRGHRVVPADGAVHRGAPDRLAGHELGGPEHDRPHGRAYRCPCSRNTRTLRNGPGRNPYECLKAAPTGAMT